MKRRLRFFLAVIMFLSAFSIIGAAQKKEKPDIPQMYIPVCKTPPKIDGRLNDECWKHAKLVDTFYLVGKDGVVKKHKAYVIRDATWLYVGFEVAFPSGDRELAKYFKHDQLVQREDNVQVSFDPGTNGSLYYQFLVNKINTRADFRMTRANGRERENFNIPWKSATTRSAEGWICEIALPFSMMLSHGDLSRAKFNLIITSFIPERDQQQVIIARTREKSSWASLVSSFHEPARFGKLLRMDEGNYRAPFLPFLEKVKIGKYYLKQGKYYYNVSAELKSLSGKSGRLRLIVEDRPSDGRNSKVTENMSLKGNTLQKIVIPVPVEGLLKRTAILSMTELNTGEIFQSILIDETSDLDLFAAYLDRNYYTSEENALAVCSVNLPPDGLKGMLLQAKDADGKILAGTRDIKPLTEFRIPIKKLPLGSSRIRVQLCRRDGAVASSQELDLLNWLAQLYWLYYKYILDEDFLKNRALPFIKGVMRVFEETLKEKNGKLSIRLSISAEYMAVFKEKNTRQNSGRNPSYQLACTRMLADILIEACEIVGEKPKKIWLDIKQNLPHYTLIGEEGNEHIAIWEGQDLDVCHRHHSHLACIYPFDTLPAPTPEQERIIDNSIDHWILRGMGQWSEWCYPWAAIIQARMGFKESPVLLLNLWKEIFINEGMATAYLPRFQGLTAHRRADMLKPKETNERMQLDGTMAGATAIIEMLVHQRGDTVYLFRGVPDKWLDISFRNVRLPGAFLISAVRKNGKLEAIRAKSLKGGKLKIELNGKIEEFMFNANEEKNLIPHNHNTRKTLIKKEYELNKPCIQV
jgi:hypothetical protein